MDVNPRTQLQIKTVILIRTCFTNNGVTILVDKINKQSTSLGGITRPGS
jgi:hypothetical protein